MHLLSAFFVLPCILFSSASAATFTVTTVADMNDNVCDAHCFLREAIGAANNTPGNDAINFAASLSNTITLTQGEILIASETANDVVTINGIGAKNLTIFGSNASRVFRVQLFSELVINDLTIKNGNGTGGGITGGGNIYNSGRLTLNCVVVSNGTTGSANGAGLYLNGGVVTVNSSTFNDNSALPSGEGGASPVNLMPPSQTTFSK
jgi:CSLREA domain-containing protein